MKVKSSSTSSFPLNMNRQFLNVSKKKNKNNKFKNKKLNKNKFKAKDIDFNLKTKLFKNNKHLNGDRNVRTFSGNLNDQRNELPISLVRNKIIEVIKKWETVVFLGETGSGKTTQIPQYLYESNFVPKNGQNNGVIGVTQPRRVAAITIAGRVATEMSCQLGSIVGYSVRFEDMTSSQTKIKYMTDGILLREAISDPLLHKYKVIILDEVHERTLHTDILLGVVKTAQQLRHSQQMPVLKVIVMSATMDCDHFSQYFNKAPVYYILGRQHSIQVLPFNKSFNYIKLCLN